MKRETAGDVAEDGAEDDGEDDEFQGLQETLEILATELDEEAAAAGHSKEELAALEQQVDDAVEALVILFVKLELRLEPFAKIVASKAVDQVANKLVVAVVVLPKRANALCVENLAIGKEMQNALRLPSLQSRGIVLELEVFVRFNVKAKWFGR